MDTQRKVLGVIGGLGPMATAYFMELVTSMTVADCDQAHLQMIVYSDPAIPDRTAHILDKSSASPLPRMIQLGKMLAAQNAGCIAVPCITAHYFWQGLQNALDVPVLQAVEETVKHLCKHGIRKAGILATDGTIATRLLQSALECAGIAVCLPDCEAQRGIMELIYRDIKAGNPPDMQLFDDISKRLFASGAEAIVLACTELSLIKRNYAIGPGFIDALEVLAQQAVLSCGGQLKEEYRCLITR